MSMSPTPSRFAGRRPLAALLSLLILAFPAATLVVPRGGNAVMFLLVVLSLVFCCLPSHAKDGASDRQKPLFKGCFWSAAPHERVLIVSLLLPVLFIMLAELLHGRVEANTLDSPSRFVLAILMFYGLRRANGAIGKWCDLGFALGGIAAAAVSFYFTAELAAARAESTFLNPIHFGDIALLLAVLSALSVHWLRRDTSWVVALKLIGCVGGFYASWASQSRGGWLALPAIAVICLFWGHGLSKRARWASALLFVLVIGGTLALSQTVRSRFDTGFSDLSAMSAGHMDTSLGIRIQLWKAAVKLIGENPVLGLGAHGYHDAMPAMAAAGVVTPMAAQYGEGEVHNQILAYTSDYGLFGLIAILAIYFGPAWFFVRSAARNQRAREHRAALMGLIVTVSFFIFGLSVETFDLKVTTAFYATMLAVLAAFAYPARLNDPTRGAPSRE